MCVRAYMRGWVCVRARVCARAWHAITDVCMQACTYAIVYVRVYSYVASSVFGIEFMSFTQSAHTNNCLDYFHY